MYSLSYYSLTITGELCDGRNLRKSNYPPRALGSGASPLPRRFASQGATPQELKLLRLWLDTGAAYPGTYAALGTGMIGGYAQNNLDRSDASWPSMRALAEVQARRCGGCHTGSTALPASPSDDMGMPPWAIDYASPRLRFSRHILYNLTRPEKSLLVLAPLAVDAGGLGLCREGKEPVRVFSSAEDADCETLLEAVRDAARRLDEIKRFDMAGFRPRDAYLREMRRYGLLPADLPADAPVDFYALEEKYWQSFWYQPPARASAAR